MTRMSDARWSASSGSHDTDGSDEATATDRTQRIDVPRDEGVAATRSLPATGSSGAHAAEAGANPFQPETAPTAWSAESGSAYAAQSSAAGDAQAAAQGAPVAAGTAQQGQAPVSGATPLPDAAAPVVTTKRPWYKRAWAKGVAGVAVVLASFGLGWASHDVTSTSTSTSQQQGGSGGQQGGPGGAADGSGAQDGQGAPGQMGQPGQDGQGAPGGTTDQSGESDSSSGVLQGGTGDSGQTAPTDGATDAASASTGSNT